jgi:hypothetical protein
MQGDGKKQQKEAMGPLPRTAMNREIKNARSAARFER